MTHLNMHNVSCKRRLHVPHLELAAGVYGLIGPNGAGKTTLLRAIAGFLPTKGSIDTPQVAIARTGADIRSPVPPWPSTCAPHSMCARVSTWGMRRSCWIRWASTSAARTAL